ncbi:MAG: CoA transferase [Betaproteobacteria bacterium]
MAGALAGLKVLDLSRFIAGPYCALMLGDLGADVVKVERPRVGEEARNMPPKIGGESLYYMVFNRSKRGMTLNFRHPRAQALLRELVVDADILIENFRPGVMEKMGCSWETLSALNPRLIMARISGFGREGPLAERPCFDVIGQAMSGLMNITGQPDGPPTMAGTYVVDYTSALYATIGILAAVERRHTSGRGQLVEASLMESALSLLMTAIPEFKLFGRELTRHGNRDRYAAPAQTFKARDGVWVHVLGGSDEHFSRLAQAMQKEHLISDPRFADGEGRMKNVDAIEAIVAAWVASHDSTEVIDKLTLAHLPCAKVATIADIVDNEQVKHRGLVVDVNHAKAGAVPMQGVAVRLSESPAAISSAAPSLGEHTARVLQEWLGMSAQDVKALEQEGVI